MRVATTFDYHVVWQGQIVDRATTERVARYVCEHIDDVLGRAFKTRVVEIVHVPTGAVVDRYSNRMRLPERAAA